MINYSSKSSNIKQSKRALLVFFCFKRIRIRPSIIRLSVEENKSYIPEKDMFIELEFDFDFCLAE